MATTTFPIDSAAERHKRSDGELQPKPVTGHVVSDHVIPGEPLPPSADPDFVGAPPVAKQLLMIELQDRHHEWLLQAAARHGRTPEGYVELLVRQACAADPERVRNTIPQQKGQPAGTALR